MATISRRNVLKIGGAMAAASFLPEGMAWAQDTRTLTISTTGIITSTNPLAHASAHLYSIWGQIYGTLTRYNYVTNQLEPLIAKSWEAVEPTRWRVKLDTSLKRHDGGPAPTAQDVAYSYDKVRTDPASQQQAQLATVDRWEVVDDSTIDIITKEPFALLPAGTFTRVVIRSAELAKQHGDDVDKVAPFGWGPYALQQFAVDDQIVMKRSEYWPDTDGNKAQVAIFKRILEPEQRVNAILNNEVQIARLIPPQMVDRVKNQPGVDVVDSGGLEYMFVAMNTKFKPWDDVRMRQAVAHAIDRKLIVDRILFGLADLMESPVGPYQECYAPSPNVPDYDPEKSKALLKEAGYPDGIDVDFYTASGRYVSDRQIGEAIGQMLGEVGIRVNLQAPEYANFTQMFEKGDCPFYYTGRAGSLSSLDNLPQYFQTGFTPRTNYSNPKVDDLFSKARAAFDADERCDYLHQMGDILESEVPAVFMWTHKLVQTKRTNVNWTPDANGEVWVNDVTLA